MRTKLAKRAGMEVRAVTKVVVEFTMSDDWADCLASQADDLLSGAKDKVDHPRQELADLVSAIYEVLR